MSAKINIENISYGYIGESMEYILENVSFKVDPGEVFCLLGPNGSGKSTLLRCISNIYKPDQGRVLLDGRDIGRLSARQIARELGFVPQTLSSAFHFKVKDIVIMGRASRISLMSSPSRSDMHQAYQAMERIGIQHLAERSCHRISGGEWQLVLIARALAQSPSILLLDEPTSHLDFGNQIRILEVVDSLAKEGMGIIMASHFPDHAFLNANTVGILKNKALIGLGSPDAVITDTLLKTAYNIDIKVTYVDGSINRKICIPILKQTQLSR